jgi:sulfatase maturation enzyme AslB (radical SAM superfamily)
MITNGTISPSDEFIRVLSKTKSCNIVFSIDGTPELNPYIRFSKNNFATIENIEHTMEKYYQVPNVKFYITCSIMTYNIFKLVEIRDWWKSLEKKGFTVYPNSFNHLILNKELNIRNLTDKTRNYLIEYYSQHQIDKEFEPVLTMLGLPYLGNESHNLWVDYTLQLEKIRNNNILDIEPLLKDELVKIYD